MSVGHFALPVLALGCSGSGSRYSQKLKILFTWKMLHAYVRPPEPILLFPNYLLLIALLHFFAQLSFCQAKKKAEEEAAAKAAKEKLAAVAKEKAAEEAAARQKAEEAEAAAKAAKEKEIAAAKEKAEADAAAAEAQVRASCSACLACSGRLD